MDEHTNRQLNTNWEGDDTDQLPTEDDIERQAMRAAGITTRDLEQRQEMSLHARRGSQEPLQRADRELNDGLLFEEEYMGEPEEDSEFEEPETELAQRGAQQGLPRRYSPNHQTERQRYRTRESYNAGKRARNQARDISPTPETDRKEASKLNRQEKSVNMRQRALSAKEKELARREAELERRERELQQEHRGRNERRQGDKERKSPRRGEGTRRKRHPIRNFFLIILLIIALVAGWFLYKLNSMIEGGLSTTDLESLISEEVKTSAEGGAMASYTNIALFGVDSRDGNLGAGDNRSDIMIVASINKLNGDVKLVSLYRDTYLDIGNGNYQKANAAFAYGGPEQAVQMMNTNLDLNITDYVVTGFKGIANVIDAVGGIEIDVQEEEIQHINNYQLTMAEETGLTRKEVTAAGAQTLTGLQAVAYSRIRYTEGGDFKRTERQKEVITKTFDKLKSSGPLTMITVANAVMSDVKTSLNMTEIVALAVKAMTYHMADTNGFPNESMRTVGYIGDQSCVIPITLASNVVWLHQYLFNDLSYTVSGTVQSISDHVSQVSGY